MLEMCSKYILLIVGSTFLLGSVCAQNTIKEEIEIIREVSPYIRDATKTIKPVFDIDSVGLDIDIELRPYEIKIYSNTLKKAPSLNIDVQEGRTPNSVKALLTYGLFNSYNGQFSYSKIFSNHILLGSNLRVQQTNGTLGQKHAKQDIHIFSSFSIGETQVFGDFKFRNSMDTYALASATNNPLNSQTGVPKINTRLGDFSFLIKNNHHRLNYQLGIDYEITNSYINEQHIAASLELSYKKKRFEYLLHAQYQTLHYEPHTSINKTFVSITPNIRFLLSKIYFNPGIKYEMSTENKGEASFYPDIKMGYIFNKKTHIQLLLSGGRFFTQYADFILSDIPVYTINSALISNNEIRLNFNFYYRSKNYFDLNITHEKVKHFKNLFFTDQFSPIKSFYLGVVKAEKDPVTITQFNVRFKKWLTKLLFVKSDATYRIITGTEAAYDLWLKPQNNIFIRFGAQIKKPLSIELGMNVIGNRVILSNNNPFEISTLIFVHSMLKYKVAEKWKIALNVNNLLNLRQHYFPNYNLTGMNVQLGIAFNY